MSSIIPRVPSYRRHYSGQAIVTLQGRDYYLGKYGSLESKAKYDRLIAEYLARGRVAPARSDEELEAPTISELLVRYVKHVDSYYVQDGKPTSQVLIVKLALRVLRELYGNESGASFGPMALKTCRA